jgi:hypothetical protein
LDLAIGSGFSQHRLSNPRQVAEISLISLNAPHGAALVSSNDPHRGSISPIDAMGSSGSRKRRHSFGSVDLSSRSASLRVVTEETAADDNMSPGGGARRSDQAPSFDAQGSPEGWGALSESFNIDFQAFRNAREIEERILGRRPGSVESERGNRRRAQSVE